MANLDINPILAAANKGAMQSGATGIAIQEGTAARTESVNRSAENAAALGNASALVESALQAGQLEVQRAKDTAAVNLGTDLADISGRQARLAQEMLSAYDEKQQWQARIEEKQNTSLLEDPLAYILNSLTVNDDIAHHNSANERAYAASQQMQDLNALTSQRAQTAELLKHTTTEASAAAAVQKIKLTADQQVEEYKRLAITSNMEGAEKINALSAQDLQRASAVFNAEAAILAHQDSQARLAMASRAFNEQMREKAIKEEDDSYIKESIIRGLKVLYRDKPANWVIPDAKLRNFISGKTPLDDIMHQAYSIGTRNYLISGGEGTSSSLAVSPSEYLSLQKYQPTVTPGMKGGHDLQMSVFESLAKTDKFKDAKPAEQVQQYNTAVALAVQESLANPSSPESIGHLPGLQEIVKSIPQLANLPLTKVLAPLNTAGVSLEEPAAVFRQGLIAVADGKISVNQFAADYSTIYSTAQAKNFEVQQLRQMGLNPKIQYPVRVDVPIKNDLGLRIGNKVIEATSREAVLKAALNAMVMGTKAPIELPQISIPALERKDFQFGPKIIDNSPTAPWRNK